MHYAVPRLLHQAGLLGYFYTDHYLGNKPWLERLLKLVPARLRPSRLTRLLARKDTTIPPSAVRSFEGLGYWFKWRLSRVRNQNELVTVVAERGAAFNRKIIKSLTAPPRLIWGFNGAALELFQWAKPRGARLILEQTIVPRAVEMRLLGEELERWPDWEPTLVPFLQRDARADRERLEWELADRVVGGSQFVVDGLEQCGVVRERCRIVPYGVGLDRFPLIDASRGGESAERALRVLFVGNAGLRKGAPYLLEALRMLGSKAIEARFVGSVDLNRKVIEKYVDVATFTGAVPRSAMADMYRWADVFCLPSICEGSATVTYEALASGVPVITTLNTGSVVQDEVNGFIVPIRDSQAIADRLDRYRADRSLLQHHRRGAAAARDSVSLEAYGRRLVDLVDELG